MSEIKAGDYVRVDGIKGVHEVVEVHSSKVSIYAFHQHFDKDQCKKVYISDTPPPQITQTEVKIQSGHMAGYGSVRPKAVQLLPETERDYLIMLFDNGLRLEWFQGKWVHNNVPLPHEQEDLKHLF